MSGIRAPALSIFLLTACAGPQVSSGPTGETTLALPPPPPPGTNWDLPPSALGLPPDLRQLRGLRALIDNGPLPARISFAVVGTRGQLVSERALGAGATALLELDLTDLPLASHSAQRYLATRVHLRSTDDAGVSRPFSLRALVALWQPTPSRVPLVDAYGQRNSCAWPGKISNPDDLKNSITTETRARNTMPPPVDRDDFGGSTRGEPWQETGFFGIDRDGTGRAWFVDPLGRAFWSLGAGAVHSDHDLTVSSGQDALFAALPVRGTADFHDAVLARDGREGVGFYRWNVLRKWGSLPQWRDQVLERFDHWGLNTVGSLTEDPLMLSQKRVPHIHPFNPRHGFGAPASATGFPDVFDPRWPRHVDSQAAALTVLTKTNPWILAYAPDQALDWSQPHLLQSPRGTALRSRWIDFLKQRHHHDLPGLARTWGAPLVSWDVARDAWGPSLPPGAAPDLRAFEAVYADQYFVTVSAALKKYDPDHLIIAAGLDTGLTPELLRAAGRHTDLTAVRVNAASVRRPDLDGFFAVTGRPVILTYDIPLADQRQILPLVPAWTAPDRRNLLTRLFSLALSTPFVLGAHAERFIDAPPLGRGKNGDLRLTGVVDITDQPHADLVAALREAAARIYGARN